jgi:hypothetical protein
VARRKHELVARGDLEDPEDLGQQATVGVDHRDRLGRQAGLAQRDLELHPHRHRRARCKRVDLLHLVDRIHRRHPDGPRTLARSDLHGQGVDAAHGPVEHDRTDRTRTGHGRVHGSRTLRGRVVMRLHLETGEAQFDASVREADVVDDPRH